MGRADPEKVIRREGARAGDRILVTGTLGDSRAGLELIQRPDLNVDPAHARPVLDRHRTPCPRLREGKWPGILGGSMPWWT